MVVADRETGGHGGLRSDRPAHSAPPQKKPHGLLPRRAVDLGAAFQQQRARLGFGGVERGLVHRLGRLAGDAQRDHGGVQGAVLFVAAEVVADVVEAGVLAGVLSGVLQEAELTSGEMSSVTLRVA